MFLKRGSFWSHEKACLMLLFETRFLSIKMKKKSKLDISIAKLRNQMKMLKKEWIDIAEKIENGSSLAPGKEPD